jgi:hypothetical protein
MNLPDLKRVAPGHYKGSYCGEDFDVKKSGKEWHLHHKGRVWREHSRDEAVRSFVFQQDVDAIELPLAVDDFLRSLAERVRVATSKINPSDIEAKDKSEIGKAFPLPRRLLSERAPASLQKV